MGFKEKQPLHWRIQNKLSVAGQDLKRLLGDESFFLKTLNLEARVLLMWQGF